jgi:hypothetical protein
MSGDLVNLSTTLLSLLSKALSKKNRHDLMNKDEKFQL